MLQENIDSEAESYPSSQFPHVSSHRERDDAYRYVAASLTDKWRIASCHDGMQWIVQYRSTKDQWRSKNFFARAFHAKDWVCRYFEPDACQTAHD